MLRTYLVTIALHWQDEPGSVTERYEWLEKLRHLAKAHDLLLQEEVRPVASALFGAEGKIVHLGFEQSLPDNVDWYEQPNHPYRKAICQILDNLATIPDLQQLEFIVSPGSDPLTGLQIQLDRQTFPLSQTPSSICSQLQTQTIYSFVKTEESELTQN